METHCNRSAYLCLQAEIYAYSAEEFIIITS